MLPVSNGMSWHSDKTTEILSERNLCWLALALVATVVAYLLSFYLLSQFLSFFVCVRVLVAFTAVSYRHCFTKVTVHVWFFP